MSDVGRVAGYTYLAEQGGYMNNRATVPQVRQHLAADSYRLNMSET